jgi:MFS family permease
MISFVAALGGLLFGYDWVMVGGAKPFCEPYFKLTSQEMIGWANSCPLPGCLLGSACSGVLMDRYGHKKLLLASSALQTHALRRTVASNPSARIDSAAVDGSGTCASGTADRYAPATPARYG